MTATIDRQLRHRSARIPVRILLLAGLVLIPLTLGLAKPALAANPWATCGSGYILVGDPPSQQLFPASQKQTCTFTHATNPGLFIVPGGVTSVHVTLVGGSGETGKTGHYCDAFNFQGDGSPGGAGGVGAQVSGTLSVTPGEFLSVVVGSTGTSPFHGGAGGGGAVQATGSCPDYGGNGGNGGGASFIADSTSGTPNDLAVAGGGGGGGGGTDQPVCGPGAGGGNFAQNGGNRIEFYCAIESTVPNSGGTSDVNSNGIGGNGSTATSIETVGGGGGGGGGWHGAGGGTAGEIGGGAGGGGGTSLVPSGWTVGAPSGCADGSIPVINICQNQLSPAATAVVITYTDTTAPTTSFLLSGTSPNHNGWYTSSVGVGVGATDPDDEDAGPSSFSYPSTFQTRCSLDPAVVPGSFFGLPGVNCSLSSVTGEGHHTIYAASEDYTGNVEQVASVNFGIDETAPVTSIALGPSAPDGSNGWYRSGVVVGAQGFDPGGSGVAATRCTVDPASVPASFTDLPGSCSWPTTVSNDGQHAAYAASQDVAGNKETLAGGPRTFKIDQTAPTDSPLLSGTPGSNGWWTTDVSLAWFWSDATSGVDSNTCTSGGTTSGEGTALTLSGSCKDMAGNLASDSKSFKVDKTKPTISAAPSPSSPNGSNGWYTSNVTVHFTCGDSLSGIPSGTCPGDQTLSSESSSVSSTAQTVQDNAGNTSAQSNVVTVKIDKTAPTVGVTGVTNGATYTFGSVPAAGCSTSDGVSGVATPASVAVTGGSNGAGSFTATCSGATDKAGNQAAPVSVSYTVLYAFGGFLGPVPNATVGSTISGKLSVTFRLTDSSGQSISSSVAATLGGKLTATLSGQGITPVTAACGWNPAFAWFQCNIPIPVLTNKGSSYPYQITASENLTGSPLTVPPYTGAAADANPETVYFRSGP